MGDAAKANILRRNDFVCARCQLVRGSLNGEKICGYCAHLAAPPPRFDAGLCFWLMLLALAYFYELLMGTARRF